MTMKTNRLLGIVIVITLILSGYLLYIFGKQDDENYKKCIENYSENYCKKSIYGIYWGRTNKIGGVNMSCGKGKKKK